MMKMRKMFDIMASILFIIEAVLSSPCPIGKSCNPEISDCPKGQYSGLGDVECRIPGPGYTSTIDKDTAEMCPKDRPFSDLANGIDCSDCPEDYTCSGPSIVHCASGYYSDLGENYCQPCPQDIDPSSPLKGRCDEKEKYYSTEEKCEPGKYIEENDCHLCPAGKYCPGLPPVALDCLEGYYSLGGEKNCTLCPAGSSCTSKAQKPEVCQPGNYSVAGYKMCVLCPPGFSCAIPNAVPIKCPTGYFSQAGAVKCSPCPADHFCTKPSSLPQPCKKDEHSEEGAGVCKACPKGKICDSRGNIIQDLDSPKRPFQIVHWNEGELELQEKEVELLFQVMEGASDVIGFSAIGRTRSGKSTSMNMAVRDIIRQPHEKFEVVHGFESATEGIYIDVYSSIEVTEEYSFLNKGYERKIVFIDSEGTRQDGSLEADIASIVSIIMSSNCFIHCEKTYYGDITTINKIIEIMKEIGIENIFRTIKYSILIKGGYPPTDIAEAKNKITRYFEMLPFPSVFFIPPPDSVKNAVNETSTDFADAMKKALKESVENNTIPIPYETWKNSLNLTIHGIEMIPFCNKHPDSPIGIKKSLSSLSQFLKNKIPSKESYSSYFNNVTMCLVLYSRIKNKPENFSQIWEEIENLQHKLFQTKEILKIFIQNIKKSIDNLENIKQNGLENIREITITVQDKLSGGDIAGNIVKGIFLIITWPYYAITDTDPFKRRTHQETRIVREINLTSKQLAEGSIESSFLQIIGVSLFCELNSSSILEKSLKNMYFSDDTSLKMIENWVQQIVNGIEKESINSLFSGSPLTMNSTSTERIINEQNSKEVNKKEWSKIISRLSKIIYANHFSNIGTSLESFIYQGNPFESSIGSSKMGQIMKMISCYKRTIKKIVKKDLNLMAIKLRKLIKDAASLFQF